MLRRSITVAALAAMTLFACSPNSADKKTANSASNPPAAGAPERSSGPDARGGRSQAVLTTRTRIENIPLILEVQGNIVALDEVELRPQKNGTIKEVLVSEGADVRRGQLLFTLDDRDDNANVQKAEAAVTGALTSLSIARRDLERNQDLSARNFISPAALDVFKNKVDAAESVLAQNKAMLEQARVSRSYTRITAPFDGRAGRVDIRPGALVTASATAVALVKITRMHPIGVSFALPERDLPGLLTAQKSAPVKITATADGKTELHGQVSFIDSSVDRSSGTIAVKAKLDNTERKAWPGQYVNVKVIAGYIENAVVLPAQAVIHTPNGRIVYVVQNDSTVQPQPVEVVRIFEQKAIVKGIAADVKVVQEGGQNLRPGAQVTETRPGERNGKGEHTRSADQSTNKETPTARTPTNTAEHPADAQKETVQQSTVALPDGFTPRDPERWAAASDEQKRAIIERWRERKATGAGAQ